VVLALVSDPTGLGPAVAVGAAARTTVGDAVLAAIGEAYGVWRSVRRAIYTGAGVPDDTSRLDRNSRLLWWADPKRSDQVRWLTDGPKNSIVSSGPSSNADAELERLTTWFRAASEDVIVVDLTDEAMVSRLQYHVVGVVVPGFHPLHLVESLPASWSRRLESVPAALGLPVTLELNPLPHPFP
jgi:ribosomal protein S12 methylthiotransferase accessory factor YcaO